MQTIDQLFQDPNYNDSKAASYLIEQLAVTAVFNLANKEQDQKLFQYVQSAPDAANAIPFALIALGYENLITEIESKLWKAYAGCIAKQQAPKAKEKATNGK